MHFASAFDQLAFVLHAVAEDIRDIVETEDVPFEEVAGVLDQVEAAARRLELIAARSAATRVDARLRRHDLAMGG